MVCNGAASAACFSAPASIGDRHANGVNSILYIASTGCQWRKLPKDTSHPARRCRAISTLGRVAVGLRPRQTRRSLLSPRQSAPSSAPASAGEQLKPMNRLSADLNSRRPTPLTFNDPRDPRSRTTAVARLAPSEPSGPHCWNPSSERPATRRPSINAANKCCHRAKISIEQIARTQRKEELPRTLLVSAWGT
jgi:hypothetical protein